MTRVSAITLAMVSATQAAALTCVPTDPISTFRMAQEAPESYVVLYGQLDFDPAEMPGGDQTILPGATETLLAPITARFRGFALGFEGFTRPVRAEVLLQPVCFSQWCGSIGPGNGQLLFAEPSSNGGQFSYQVEINPCGMWTFDQVPQTTLDALVGCLRAENCGP